jgi:hypothetical protein
VLKDLLFVSAVLVVSILGTIVDLIDKVLKDVYSSLEACPIQNPMNPSASHLSVLEPMDQSHFLDVHLNDLVHIYKTHTFSIEI